MTTSQIAVIWMNYRNCIKGLLIYYGGFISLVDLFIHTAREAVGVVEISFRSYPCGHNLSSTPVATVCHYMNLEFRNKASRKILKYEI